MTRDDDNARRLAGVLHRYADDPHTVQQLAAVLNYHAPQLQEDMESLYRCVCRREAETTHTAKYTAKCDRAAKLGERIRDARRGAGLTQTELANRLGRTLRTVQKYESGEIVPTIPNLMKIAKALDVQMTVLIP